MKILIYVQSVITGITTLFEYGLTTGGPGVMSVGWIIVAFFTFFVGLGMAEVTSAHPTSVSTPSMRSSGRALTSQFREDRTSGLLCLRQQITMRHSSLG